MSYLEQLYNNLENQRTNKSDIWIRDVRTNSIRAIKEEDNERKFVISFSSEEPYNRWYGTEILDHSEGCLDLTRLTEIGCVLFNHKRDCVIGKITKAWVENNRGCAEIEFDTDEESEKIYQKVKNGTLKGISVGYQVDSWEEVMPNKTSADGKFKGPASIARKWTPLEVSVVSIPADSSVGVGRDLEQNKKTGTRSLQEWQVQINKNKQKLGGSK